MLRRILELFTWGDLIRNLVLRNLRIRYQGSALGFFWTMLNPLFMMGIYFIFISLLKIPINLSELLVGILCWQFFVMCLSDSVNAVTGYPSLVKRTSFPRLVFPVSMVIANLVNFLLSLLVLAAFLLVYTAVFGHPLHLGASWLLLPLAILLQTVLILGLSSFFACWNVYFRDVEHIMSIILLAWFFLSPVMYPLSEVLKKTAGRGPLLFNLYLLNPMASLITLYRFAILGTPVPETVFFYISLLLAPLIFILGMALFLKKEPYFADEI